MRSLSQEGAQSTQTAFAPVIKRVSRTAMERNMGTSLLQDASDFRRKNYKVQSKKTRRPLAAGVITGVFVVGSACDCSFGRPPPQLPRNQRQPSPARDHAAGHDD